jgi:mycothiol system anti-sigma-R factor
MIDCREAVRRMWAYLGDALSVADTADVEAHLQVCQRCCGELEFSREMREMVARREGMPPLPDELRARIDALLVDAEEAPGTSS